MSYESPINVYENLANEIATWKEDKIVTQVQMCVDVNKAELIKALAYDRHQYEKGYADARREFERPSGEWELKENEFIVAFQCTACRKFTLTATPFCPNCGARMNMEE